MCLLQTLEENEGNQNQSDKLFELDTIIFVTDICVYNQSLSNT